MERHAVPQNIMEVEFKLFGALSVKQFAYLASGLLGALVIYFLPFPFALRFVLIIIAVILGLFLSLIKINGQYSSVWLANFVVAMFTSQERVWKKTGYVPDIFHEEVKRTKNETLEKVKKEGSIKASVAPLTKFEVKVEPTQADRDEELRLKQIESQMFSTDAALPLVQDTPTTPVENTLPPIMPTLPPLPTETPTETPAETPAETMTATTELPLTITPATEETTTEKIVIKGYVMNKDSQPVADALVSVNMEKGDFVKEVVTDERGYFDLGIGLDPGIYFANIAAPKLEFDYYKIKIKPEQNILYKFTAK